MIARSVQKIQIKNRFGHHLIKPIKGQSSLIKRMIRLNSITMSLQKDKISRVKSKKKERKLDLFVRMRCVEKVFLEKAG